MTRQPQVEMTHKCGCKTKRIEKKRWVVETSDCKKCTPKCYPRTGINFVKHECGHTSCFKSDYAGYDVYMCQECRTEWRDSHKAEEVCPQDEDLVGVPHRCGHVVEHRFEDVREEMLKDDCGVCKEKEPMDVIYACDCPEHRKTGIKGAFVLKACPTYPALMSDYIGFEHKCGHDVEYCVDDFLDKVMYPECFPCKTKEIMAKDFYKKVVDYYGDDPDVVVEVKHRCQHVVKYNLKDVTDEMFKEDCEVCKGSKPRYVDTSYRRKLARVGNVIYI